MPRLRTPSGVAWLAVEVLEALTAEASAKALNETGGVLLGYWVQLGTEVVLTDSIGPGPRAVHGPKDFLPDHEYHEVEIARKYKASGRRTTYLGDWHSHAGGTTSLSRKDEKTLANIARERAARAPTPLMAVIAGDDPWTVAVWCGELRSGFVLGKRLESHQLQVRIYNQY